MPSWAHSIFCALKKYYRFMGIKDMSIIYTIKVYFYTLEKDYTRIKCVLGARTHPYGCSNTPPMDVKYGHDFYTQKGVICFSITEIKFILPPFNELMRDTRNRYRSLL